MKIGVPKETRPGESRVAATPDSCKKLIGLGAEVVLEAGAGVEAHLPDSEYEKAGVKISDRSSALGADIVVKVACPTEEETERMREGALCVSLMDPFGEGKERFTSFASRKVSAIAMELIPRTTRAQSMDVLSSQANIAGYKAVIEGAHHYGKMFPMMMTAAGSVPPAKLFVLGAGVAGLQAIATARRLGAQVEAFDVRPEVKEEIQSLGAKFLDLGLEESGAGEGGYAKELTKESQERQRAALTRELARADIVITTALIPGRPAPVLVTEEAVRNMKPGSVVVDLAAANGGNCPLSEPDMVVVKEDVTIVGHTNLPSMLANHASQFYARNLVNLLQLLVVTEDEKTVVKIDLEDDIIDAALAVHDGQVRWPRQAGN